MTFTPGDVYGKFKLLERLSSEVSGKNRAFTARCQCGAVKILYVSNMMQGRGKECRKCSCKKNITHGMSGTRTYNIWLTTVRRCHVETVYGYSMYGGCGIIVYKGWRYKFENFLKDMGEAPPGMGLQRIDIEGDFEPGNCVWMPLSEIRERIIERRIKLGIERRKNQLPYLPKNKYVHETAEAD